MKKGTLPLIGITAATLSITACVTQLWEVTYPGPDGYHSEAYDIAEDSNGNVLLLGRTRTQTNEDTLFIAKYNNQGELLWDYTEADFLNVRWPNKDYLLINSNNQIFYAASSLDYKVRVGLINSDGEPLWQKAVYSSANDFPLFLDMAITTDQQHLILTVANGLEAYSSDGDLLWQFTNLGSSSGAGTADELNLDNYPAAPPPFSTGEVVVSNNNAIYVSASNSIYKLDANGNLEDQLSAGDIDADAIWDIDVGGNHLAVLSTNNNNNVTLHILDEDFNPLNAHQIESGLLSGYIHLSDNKQLCFALNSDSTNSTLTQGLMNDTELVWQTSDTGEFHYRDLVDAQAGNDNCQFTTAESIESPAVTSYTRVYGSTGELEDTLTLRDYYVATSLTSGANIYSAGITGEYDGSITEATLTKHNVR